MGRRRGKDSKCYTLPSSPSSSSSSDFEFTISISPRKSSTSLCPADELFYKGQLLPLHLSPRISMVRTLLLSSSSSSTSTSSTARDSTGSSSNDSHSSFNSDPALFPDCDSSRPSSVTEDDEFKRLHNPSTSKDHNNNNTQMKKTHKYFSLSRFSSVFRKDNNVKTREAHENVSASSVKRMSATAKEVIRKYLKKVKPLYEKFSQKHRTGESLMEEGCTTTTRTTVLSLLTRTERSKYEETDQVSDEIIRKENMGVLSHSFSGNLRYPRRRSCVSSCPSSMRSSPSHSGVLSFPTAAGGGRDTSSMEELQSAIQGAIAHCKNSLIQNNHNKTIVVSNQI